MVLGSFPLLLSLRRAHNFAVPLFPVNLLNQSRQFLKIGRITVDEARNNPTSLARLLGTWSGLFRLP